MNLQYNLIGGNTIDSKRGGNAKVEEKATYVICPLNKYGTVDEKLTTYSDNIAIAATFSWNSELPKGDIEILRQEIYGSLETLLCTYDMTYYEDEHRASFVLYYGDNKLLSVTKSISSATSFGPFIQDVLDLLLETFPNKVTVHSLSTITYLFVDAMKDTFGETWGEGSITAKIPITILTYNNKQYRIELSEIEESIVEPKPHEDPGLADE